MRLDGVRVSDDDVLGGVPGSEEAARAFTSLREHALAGLCLLGDGLVAGRALCLAPVTRLDPADWAWPDDGDHEWPLCWICLALTH